MTSHQNVSIPSLNRDLSGLHFVPGQAGRAAPKVVDDGGAGNGASAEGSTSQDSGSGRPGLIVLHDHYGPDDETSASAERLAALGYAVVAPDLFGTGGAPPDTTTENAIFGFTLGIPDSRIIDDISATLVWLQQQEGVDAERIGIVGWGWGGAYALMAAGHDGRIKAAIDVGGHLTYPVLTAEKPGSPINFVGSIEGVLLAAFPGNDPQFPAVEVQRLTHQILEHERRGEVKIYAGAPPRFWRDPSLPQTALLWRRIETVLASALAGAKEEEDFGNEYPSEDSRLHA